jgi:hypothetical protein
MPVTVGGVPAGARSRPITASNSAAKHANSSSDLGIAVRVMRILCTLPMSTTPPRVPSTGGEDPPSAAPAARGRALLALAVVLAILAAWTVGRHGATIVQAGYDSLKAPSHNLADSDLDPLAYFASTRALSGARDLIPPGATYTVVVGTAKPPSSQLPGPALKVGAGSIVDAFRLWLLPRPYVPLRRAQWVIAYDVSPGALGVKVGQTFELGPDATVVEVAPP